MALIRCKECGKEHSTDAKTCPHCGKPRKSRIFKIIFGVVVLTITAQVVINQFVEKEVQTPEQLAAVEAAKALEVRKRRLELSRIACVRVLKTDLNDPDSAQMTDSSSWHVQELNDGGIQVQLTGRAKNVFGAYIKGVWDCRTMPDGERVKVLSVTQIEP